MAVKYRLVARKDLHKGVPADKKLFYASANSTAKLDFNQICKSVSAYSTASRGDVQVSLDGLLFVMEESLARGETVQLGEFGNFRIVIGSEGTATAEEFTVGKIRRSHIIFTPGRRLREMLASLRYERIGAVPSSPTTPPDAGGGDDVLE